MPPRQRAPSKPLGLGMTKCESSTQGQTAAIVSSKMDIPRSPSPPAAPPPPPRIVPAPPSPAPQQLRSTKTGKTNGVALDTSAYNRVPASVQQPLLSCPCEPQSQQKDLPLLNWHDFFWGGRASTDPPKCTSARNSALILAADLAKLCHPQPIAVLNVTGVIEPLLHKEHFHCHFGAANSFWLENHSTIFDHTRRPYWDYVLQFYPYCRTHCSTNCISPH